MVEHQMLTVSAPPHIYGKDTTKRRMRDVLIALAPAGILGIIFYGLPGFRTIAIAIIAAIVAEALYQKIVGKKVTVRDLSAVLTGLLLAFNLPPAVPFWIPIIGSFFAIIVVKQLFGGLGQNFINPALGARAFLLASFPIHMTSWTFAEDSFAGPTPDAISSATFLARLKFEELFSPTQADYMETLF